MHFSSIVLLLKLISQTSNVSEFQIFLFQTQNYIIFWKGKVIQIAQTDYYLLTSQKLKHFKHKNNVFRQVGSGCLQSLSTRNLELL